MNPLRSSRWPLRQLLLRGAVLALMAMIPVSARVASGAENDAPAPLALEYRLRLARPTSHLVEVEISATGVREPALDFVMPAWSPGRYAIYNFAKNVQEFEAWDVNGQKLAWAKLDKQTWHVESRLAGGTARVRYRVFANDLSGTFSQFDSTHANLNGGSIYMYIAGHKQDPLTLTVEPPAGSDAPWKILSGFSLSIDQRTFRAPNYDLLADTPMEISPECSLDEFRESGKTFRVVVHSYAEEETSRAPLLDGLKKIVRSELSMMPAPDLDHYTFIFHFAPDIALGDGMEHLNSTQIVVRGSLGSEGLAEALELAAHEFFHLWNVKRLRPAGLGPFDYGKETYTPSLWFAEGVTSYYAYLHLLRSGVWDRAVFLKRLADEIVQFEEEPGRSMMSAESSSFHAWFYDRSPQLQETNFSNSTISYYNKGLLLGLLLDLEIRSRTNGQKSLDDVLDGLYRKFYGAAPVSYYAPGRGYEEKDILEAVNAVSGSDFSPFIERTVRGTDPLPYAQTLASAGLALRVAVPPDSPPSLGVLTRRVDRGVKIVAVRPGRAADRAGLARGDLLIAVDELTLATEELRERLRIYPPGAEVPFTVERHGRRDRITVKLDPPEATQYTIEPLPGASTDQVRMREGWLGGSLAGGKTP